tara:strand:+ start:283 stop:744 length:462 start_codon:yes stop_codon:yes gene_type:complete
MANSSVTYQATSIIPPTGFTLLFTTTQISATLGDVINVGGITITHQYSGGVTSFTLLGETLNYTGEITAGQINTVAIVFDTSLSNLRLLANGVLVDTIEYLGNSVVALPVSLVGGKAWNVSDFRVFNKALSDGAVNYYHLDASSTGLGVGRLG